MIVLTQFTHFTRVKTPVTLWVDSQVGGFFSHFNLEIKKMLTNGKKEKKRRKKKIRMTIDIKKNTQ